MDCALEASCNDTINTFHTPSKQWNAYTVSSAHCLLAKQLLRNYKSGHRLLLSSILTPKTHTQSRPATVQQTIQDQRKRIKQSRKRPLETQLKDAAKATTSSGLSVLRVIHVHVPGSG
jgi:hypothetical protein